MNEESVFDNDIDKSVETQFDTADIVFALGGIRHELMLINFSMAFACGLGIAALYYSLKAK